MHPPTLAKPCAFEAMRFHILGGFAIEPETPMSDESEAGRWRVGLVEDDVPTQYTLLGALAQDSRWQLAFSVGSARELRALLAGPAADYVLLDLGLPDGSGLDLLSEIRAAWPACECLVVSVFGDEHRVIRSIEAGASGYILKGQGADEVAAHLALLREGGSPISPAIARHLLKHIALGETHRQPHDGDADDALTPAELRVLNLLARGDPYESAADTLGVSVNTVRYHVKALYGKLGVNSRQRAVLEAQRRGWLTVSAP